MKTWMWIVGGLLLLVAIGGMAVGNVGTFFGSGNEDADYWMDTIQASIDNTMNDSAWIYHLQTLHAGGAHGQPATLDEVRRLTFERVTNATGNPLGLSYNSFHYPNENTATTNAANSPVPQSGGGLGDLIGGLIGLGGNVATGGGFGLLGLIL